MQELIRCYPNNNKPIVDETNDILSLIHFNLVLLHQGQRFRQLLAHHESVLVVLSGSCRIEVEGAVFESVGQRKSIWQGKADSVYVPVNRQAEIVCFSEQCEVAVAGGIFDKTLEPFRIGPEETPPRSTGVSSNFTTPILTCLACRRGGAYPQSTLH